MSIWIEKPVEPSSLLLSWQAPEGQRDRLHWAVGIVDLRGAQTFRYLTAEEFPTFNVDRPIDRLSASGFAGYPAFAFEPGKCFDTDVLRTFLRRIPPSVRSDFAHYLEYFSIGPELELSDALVLALTEARLPGDGFSLIDPFDADAEICDAAFEIAGFRYLAIERGIKSGDELALSPDPDNPHDAAAVEVCWDGDRIGFVNRLQAPSVAKWLLTRSVFCRVLRKNGTTGAPRAHAIISVRPQPLTPEVGTGRTNEVILRETAIA